MKVDNLDYDDEQTWDLICEGKTKGVFQLETSLGRSWAKKARPRDIEELAALLSILRPGCLQAKVDGKSMSQHYVDRKNGDEKVEYIHECLENILSATYGVLIYQEQCIKIAQEIAGFSEQEADILRDAIGKKKAKLMQELKPKFIEGCSKKGLASEEVAEEIFSWIEKSSRYSFNKSHAMGYGVCSYWSAYLKVHYPTLFFTAYLHEAHEKPDPHEEIRELVAEAKLFDISIKTPTINNFKLKFNGDNQTIYFGIKDIKSLTGITGDKVANKIYVFPEMIGKPIEQSTWLEILIFLSSEINSTAFKALASIGFFRGIKDKISRNKVLYDYSIYKNLSKGEKEWIVKNYSVYRWSSLEECLTSLAPTKKEGGGTSRAARKQTVLNELQLLRNPPFDLSDDPEWVIQQEEKLLGCPIAYSKVGASDTSGANTSCKQVLEGKTGENLRIIANILRVSDYKITKGKSTGKYMSFLTLEDESGTIDGAIVFPDCRESNKYILFENNNVLFCGHAKKDGAFIVENMHELY